MQTLIDQHGPFTLPTSWAEVTTQAFCATDPLLTVEARASYFAGRPIQVNALVADALEWMLTPPDTEGGLPYPADLGQETYLQVETIRGLLAARPLNECFGQVYGTVQARRLNYQQPDIFLQKLADIIGVGCLPLPITDTWPAVAHCLTELKRLAVAYAELSEPDPTEAARRAREAGAEELMGMFGHLNVANALSLKLGVTLDAAYQLPYNTVCFYLLHDRHAAILADNIQRNASKPNE